MRNKPRNIVRPVKIELKDCFPFLKLTGTRCCKSAVFNPPPTFTRTDAQDFFNDLRYYITADLLMVASTPSSSRRLEQPLCLHRFLHLRACAYAVEIG